MPTAGVGGLAERTQIFASSLRLNLVSQCDSAMNTSPPFLAMSPSPAGLAPMEGIPMTAQAVLHREILHVHAFLDHAPTLLRTRLAIFSLPFMERITSPHLQVQLRGLDSAIRQATQATHTALHYTHELMTTFGLIHTLYFDAAQLEAELRGTTSFRDHRISPPRPPPRPPSSSTTTTSTPTLRRLHGLTAADDDFYYPTLSWHRRCYFDRTSFPRRASVAPWTAPVLVLA